MLLGMNGHGGAGLYNQENQLLCSFNILAVVPSEEVPGRQNALRPWSANVALPCMGHKMCQEHGTTGTTYNLI